MPYINPAMSHQYTDEQNTPFWETGLLILHETPSSVMSAILHEYDIILTVILSMISTYRYQSHNRLVNKHDADRYSKHNKNQKRKQQRMTEKSKETRVSYRHVLRFILNTITITLHSKKNS